MDEAKNTTETFNDIIHADTPVLVDFSAEWCQPCKLMKPILKELHEMMGNKIRIIKVDIDQSPAASSFYNVTSVPTLILFQWADHIPGRFSALPYFFLSPILILFLKSLPSLQRGQRQPKVETR